MTQRIWTIVDETTGLPAITVTADTDMKGVASDVAINWFPAAKSEALISVLSQANLWLAQNGVS